jgi:hypothetical protein
MDLVKDAISLVANDIIESAPKPIFEEIGNILSAAMNVRFDVFIDPNLDESVAQIEQGIKSFDISGDIWLCSIGVARRFEVWKPKMKGRCRGSSK